MNRLRTAVVVLVLLAALGCATGGGTGDRAQLRLGEEAVAPRVSQRTLRGWREEVWPSWEAVEAMRAAVQRRGHRLLGVAFLRGGFHPYYIVAFIDAGPRVVVVDTQLFWGQVLRKRVIWLSDSDYESVLEAARRWLPAVESEGLPGGWGALWVHWTPDGPVYFAEEFLVTEESDVHLFVDRFNEVVGGGAIQLDWAPDDPLQPY